ncbi:MAG: hypothetical protein EA359_15350, partial [Balneolaceae bacterium]
MRRLKILSMAMTLFMSAPSYSSAQNEQIIKPINQKNLLVTTSLSYARYRDFATSPLFYEGGGTNLYLGWQTINDNRELTMGLDFLVNLTLANTPKSDFYETNTLGVFSGLEGSVSYLRNVRPDFSEKYDFKLGGILIGNQNMRLNPALDNSSVGIESIVNLMLSGKVQRDISRREETVSNFLFLSIRNRPVRRTLAFQMDAGVLNFNRRPGYNFFYDGPVDGTNTSMFSYVWDQYSWSMNGWR